MNDSDIIAITACVILLLLAVVGLAEFFGRRAWRKLENELRRKS